MQIFRNKYWFKKNTDNGWNLRNQKSNLKATEEEGLAERSVADGVVTVLYIVTNK